MKLLEPAIRQYRHNNSDEFVKGLDYEETVKIVNMLLKVIKAQSRLLVAYRVGAQPPEWVSDTIQKAKKHGIDV